MRLKISLKDCQKSAASHNGKCLSKIYNHSHEKMLWKCQNRLHSSWPAAYNKIKRGQWCRRCASQKKADKKRLKPREIKVVLKKLGLLWIGSQSEYQSGASQLSVKNLHCKHKFQRSYGSLTAGHTSCIICNSNIGENRCREIFNKTFKQKFIKVRNRIVSWLKTNKGSLELDGYCDKFKIAFEYGDHNWNYNGKIELKKLQERDKLKSNLCKQHGIRLYQIKESNSIENIFEQIIQQSKKFKVKLLIKKVPKINLKNVYISNSKKYWNQMLLKAQMAGFKILSQDDGCGSFQKIIKECQRGHVSSVNLSRLMYSGFKCHKCMNYQDTLKTTDNIIKWMRNNNGQEPREKSNNLTERRYGNFISRHKLRNFCNYLEIVDKFKKAGYKIS